METLAIIPARYASTRFPGKPLAPLTAPDGTTRPLIEWTWRAGVAALGADAVVVATDDERIAAAARSFGGRVAMTSPSARNGTERCAEVIDAMDRPPELVINLQGDNPLVPPATIAALIARFAAGCEAPMATPYMTCDAAMQAALLEDHARGAVGGTCVVARADGMAAYFSKRPIPWGADAALPLKLHIGLYAYRPDALRAYAALAPSPLELAEGLEQLRFLEAGLPIALVEVPRPAAGLWEVNNPHDVARVEAALPA